MDEDIDTEWEDRRREAREDSGWYDDLDEYPDHVGGFFGGPEWD